MDPYHRRWPHGVGSCIRKPVGFAIRFPRKSSKNIGPYSKVRERYAHFDLGKMYFKPLILFVIFLALGLGVFRIVPPAAPTESSVPGAKKEAVKEAPLAREAIPDGQYTIVPGKSIVRWQGRKPLLQGDADNGTLGTQEADGTIRTGRIVGGKIVFDMTQIKVASTGSGRGDSTLEAHLKSDDFFATEQFPTAEFVIAHISQDSASGEPFGYLIHGTLTLKGITNSLEVPATAYMADDVPHLDIAMEVDRTQWNIRYGSGTFFDNLANNVIDDKFGVTFHLVGERAEAQ